MVPKDYVDEVISSLFEDAVDPKISVVGVGGAGGRMVSVLYDREMKGVETVAVNTDPAGLSKAECDVKVLLPHTEDEDRIAAARASAESQEPELRASLSSDIVFVVAGLGGGAGTGAGGARGVPPGGGQRRGRRQQLARPVRGPALLQRGDAGRELHGRHDRPRRRRSPEQGLPHDPRRGSRERGEGDRGTEQPRGPRRGPAGRDRTGGVGPRTRGVRRAGLHRPPLIWIT